MDYPDKIREFKTMLQEKAPIDHKEIWWDFGASICAHILKEDDLEKTFAILSEWAVIK